MIKTNYNVKVSFACEKNDNKNELHLVFNFTVTDKDDLSKDPLTFSVCDALSCQYYIEGMQNSKISSEMLASTAVNEAVDHMICELTSEDLFFGGDDGKEVRYKSADQKYKISRYDFVSKLVINLLIQQVAKAIQQEIQ